jgi:hypothetical protein
VAKLIKNIGYIGKIDNFTIKLLIQNLFLLVGFSRTLGTASEASYIYRDTIGIQLQYSKAVDTRATVLCKDKLLYSKDNNILNNRDPDLSSSSNVDRSSAEDKQGHSSTRKHSM